MRKKLLAGVLLVLGSLGALQAHGATIVHDAIKYVVDAYNETKKDVFNRGVALRELEMLLKEAQQLQIAINNAKRASPKLWDDSLNAFENLTNGSDQVNTILSAADDLGGALKRAGCLNGAVEGGTGAPITESTPINFDVKEEELGTVIAAYENQQLGSRCKQLAAKLKKMIATKDAAEASIQNVKSQSTDGSAGTSQILDALLAEMMKARALKMQEMNDQAISEKADLEQKLAEAQQRKLMHDRLMKAPSSGKKMEARNPEMSVDPNDF